MGVGGRHGTRKWRWLASPPLTVCNRILPKPFQRSLNLYPCIHYVKVSRIHPLVWGRDYSASSLSPPLVASPSLTPLRPGDWITQLNWGSKCWVYDFFHSFPTESLRLFRVAEAVLRRCWHPQHETNGKKVVSEVLFDCKSPGYSLPEPRRGLTHKFEPIRAPDSRRPGRELASTQDLDHFDQGVGLYLAPTGRGGGVHLLI